MTDASTSHNVSMSAPSNPIEPNPSTPDEFDEESSLNFYETIPTLQDIASYSVALNSWHQFATNENPESSHNSLGYFNLEPKHESKIREILHQFALPSSIRTQVECSLSLVIREINDLSHYYEFEIFEGNNVIVISDLLFCHWRPDGRIDHRKTALNMMSNSRMSLEDRFKIACKYCLEDEIRKFPFDTLYPRLCILISSFRTSPQLYYWACYLKHNDLRWLPIANDQSADLLMITRDKDSTWAAFEYFWDRLNVEEQKSKISDILLTYPKFQKNLFFKMSESVKIHALSQNPILIMRNFWTQSGQQRFALQVWIYIRNFLNYEQFKGMWKELNKTSTNVDLTEKSKYLLEIWNHCPDHLKKLAFQPEIVNIFFDAPYEYNLNHRPCGDIEFIIAYLSSASVELRKTIIFERVKALVSISDLSFTDRVIKVCLQDSKDVEEFKKYILGLSLIQNRLSELLLEQGDHIETVNKFLDYFCPDSSTRAEFCCKVLETFLPECATLNKEKWFKMIDFIDENLATLPNRALECKKSMISECKFFRWKLFSNVEEVEKLIELVALTHQAEDLDDFKATALNRSAEIAYWDKFDENVIGRFVSWCCDNDEQKLAQFKEELSIDNVFEIIWKSIKSSSRLRRVVNTEKISRVFKPLDECLKWYFQSAEDVKWFKLRKVLHYNCSDGNSMFSLDDEESSEVFTRNTLPWFFEGQQSAIDVFKGIYKNEGISRMI